MILNEHFHYCVMKNNKYVSKQIVHSQDADKKATLNDTSARPPDKVSVSLSALSGQALRSASACQLSSIVLKETVFLSMYFISEDFIEHNVLRRPENIVLHLRNSLLKGCDQLFGLQSLGIGSAVFRAA